VITASYGGSAQFASSISNAVVEVVAPGDGPRITRLQRYGYHWMRTSIVLTFDQALDPATAQDPGNYWIKGAGGRVIRVKSAVYDASASTVTLRPAERINIHHRYTLIVDGSSSKGLSNARGVLLDGARSGQPGSDGRSFITWRNLVVDRSTHKTSQRSGTASRSITAKSEPTAHALGLQTGASRWATRAWLHLRGRLRS
jgi:hypothetical protein